MKKNMKKIKISVLLALCLAAIICLTSCGAGSTPKASDANGTIEGTNIKWKFTSSDNTLEISGAGAVPNYASNADVPWSSAMVSIKTLEVEEGIVAIGERAFYGATALADVELPDSLTSIGKLSFAFCTSLETIELPANLSSVGESAFESCSKLSAINLGASLTSLGEGAFAYCANLKSVHLLSPVEVKANTFYNCRTLESFTRHSELSEEKVSADAFKGTEFTYKKMTEAVDVNKTVTVTVKYVCSDGGESPAPVVKSGLKIGESFSVVTPELDGYTADKLTVSGAAPAEDTEIIVTYEKIDEETEIETETEEPVAEEPQEPNYLALIIMIVVLAGVGVGAYFLMRSNKQNEEKAKNQNKAKNRNQK